MLNIHNYIIKKWIIMRMAAQEFGFKQPFEMTEEYPIMKVILFFALVPIELIFIFTYARLYGSLRAYTLPMLLITAIVNWVISNILINMVKEKPFINETIAGYERMDYDCRKKLNSLKNVAILVLLMAGVPWALLFISISIVCLLVPR